MIFNYRVSKTLRDILVQGKNGMLVCESATKRRLFFAEGLLIGSRSSREDERLGSVLVKKRRITAPQLAQATDQIRTGKKLGHILVELGFLTEEDIARYVRGQVVDIACNVLLAAPKRLLFSEGGEAEPVTSVSILDVFMEAARRLPGIQHYRGNLLTDDQLLGRASEEFVTWQAASLSPDEAAVLEQLESTCTTGDIVKAGPLDEDETVRILIGFLQAGIIELVHTETQATPGNAETASSKPADAIQHEVARLYTALKKQNDWEVLGLEASADLEEIRRAYQERSARFHPDGYGHVRDSEFQEQLASVFTMITNAFNALAAGSQQRAHPLAEEAPEPAKAMVPSPDTKEACSEEAASPRKNPAHARECYERAKRALVESDYWSAIELCRTAIEYGDNEADYFHLLGRALGQNSKWRKEAETNLKIATNLKPWEPRYFLSLAELYHREGLQHRARRTIEQLQAIDPTFKIPQGLLEPSESESAGSKLRSS